jgi:hypothetical protein
MSKLMTSLVVDKIKGAPIGTVAAMRELELRLKNAHPLIYQEYVTWCRCRSDTGDALLNMTIGYPQDVKANPHRRPKIIQLIKKYGL